MGRWLARRIGHVPVPIALVLGTFAAAAIAGALTAMVLHAIGPHRVLVTAAIGLPMFGALYLWPVVVFRVPEVEALTGPFARRLGRRRRG